MTERSVLGAVTKQLGVRDNTIILYIWGDNGSSAEGSVNGTPNEVMYFNGVALDAEKQMPWYDAWGTDKTYPIEADFDLLAGIDFHKGCFVGQETTSRMKRRSAIKSRMLPIAFEGPPGIVHGGAHAALAESLASVGTFRAVAESGNIAMGMSNNTTFLRSVSSGSIHAEAIAISCAAKARVVVAVAPIEDRVDDGRDLVRQRSRDGNVARLRIHAVPVREGLHLGGRCARPGHRPSRATN